MHSKTYITVRYAETDKMGVAHHANYPIWYEIGRTDFIKMFGTSYSEMEEAGVMTPVLNLTCHYGKPAMFEDKLIVRTWCIHMTAARIEFAYSIKVGVMSHSHFIGFGISYGNICFGMHKNTSLYIKII